MVRTALPNFHQKTQSFPPFSALHCRAGVLFTWQMKRETRINTTVRRRAPAPGPSDWLINNP